MLSDGDDVLAHLNAALIDYDSDDRFINGIELFD